MRSHLTGGVLRRSPADWFGPVTASAAGTDAERLAEFLTSKARHLLLIPCDG